MKEAYYEESASCQNSVKEAKLYAVFRISAIICFVVAALLLPYAFTYIPYLLGLTEDTAARIVGIGSYAIVVLLIGGAGAAFWFLKNKFNVSYDYTFVEDELRVSKVLGGKSRKFLKSFKADQMLKLGKCGSEGFESACRGLDKKNIIRLTPNRTAAGEKEFYYFLYSSTLERSVYILEARQILIEYLVSAAGRNKWEPR